VFELADAERRRPVNAPFSWPNSSLSRRSSGSAAQFTLTNVRLRRTSGRESRRATSSLPTPAFAANEHGDVVVGHAIDDRRDRLHGVAVGPEGARLIVVDLAPELGDFRHELPLLDGLLDGGFERDLAEAVGIVGFDDRSSRRRG